MRARSDRFRGDVIMLTPPFRERGRQPALEGIRAGAAIHARTSLGAAFGKSQSRESGMISQHRWGRGLTRPGELDPGWTATAPGGSLRQDAEATTDEQGPPGPLCG